MVSENYIKSIKKHIQKCEQELVSKSPQITLYFQLFVLLRLLIP